jgi:hypothetical protein
VRPETQARLKDAARMHCGETAETSKVGHVQREYMAHTVNAHGRGQSRIVHLNTQHLVLDGFLLQQVLIRTTTPPPIQRCSPLAASVIVSYY